MPLVPSYEVGGASSEEKKQITAHITRWYRRRRHTPTQGLMQRQKRVSRSACDI